MAEARATTPREWALAVGGGLLLCGALVWWLRPGAPEQAVVPAVEMTLPAADVRQAAPVAEAPEALALTLRGVVARGDDGSAIFEDADGRQRRVIVGRLAAPGWRLVAVDAGSATLEAGSGAMRTLRFEVPEGGGGVAAAALSGLEARPEALAATSTAYRLALRPIAGETEIDGWTVQTPETVPLFALAGLRAGDVLLAINGQPLFSEEKVLDLPSEIAGANAVELEYRRAGRKATVRIDLKR